MTGDGLQDIVLLRSGNIAYWPNLGHGRCGVAGADAPGAAAARRARPAPAAARRRRRRRRRRPGLRRPRPGAVVGQPVRQRVDRGAGHRAPAPPTWSTPTPCSSPTCTAPGWPGCCSAAAPTGPARPRCGSSTSPAASSRTCSTRWTTTSAPAPPCSTCPRRRFLLADEADPATRWRTPLPFPVQVVARVEVHDAISAGRLTTEYRYHHGYWDGVEREFRGFAMVEQLDTETFDGRRRAARRALLAADADQDLVPPRAGRRRRGRRLDRTRPHATSTGPTTPRCCRGPPR